MRDSDFTVRKVRRDLEDYVIADVYTVSGNIDMSFLMTLTKDEWELMARSGENAFIVKSKYMTVKSDFENDDTYIQVCYGNTPYTLYFSDDPGLSYLARDVLKKL